jgi:hypothetical protein
VDRHEVVIEADWHVHVPHDVPAERVAVGLGGYLTCVELVDRALPAARGLFGLVRRQRFPELRRGGDRVWVPARPVEGCCRRPSIRYSGPGEAAVHLRGVPHAAATHGAGQGLVSAVFAAVMRAHGYDRDMPFPKTEARRASACVAASARDIELLWLAGVAPKYVVAVHKMHGVPGRPLPVNFYLGLVTARPDLAWVSGGDSGMQKPDPTHGLSAQQSPARGEARNAQGDWSSARLPDGAITDLTIAGYVPTDIELLVSATGRSGVGVASSLRAWLAAGCRPSASELVELYEAGVSPFWMPRSAAVSRLRESVGNAQPSIPDKQLGFLLAVCGSVPSALAWVRAGHRDALRVAGALAAGLEPDDKPSAGKATHAHAR